MTKYNINKSSLLLVSEAHIGTTAKEVLGLLHHLEQLVSRSHTHRIHFLRSQEYSSLFLPWAC